MACMEFSHTVIAFSGLNLPYAVEAPHPDLILRRPRYSEHSGVKIGSVGAKKLLSFSCFFFSFFFFHNMLRQKSV